MRSGVGFVQMPEIAHAYRRQLVPDEAAAALLGALYDGDVDALPMLCDRLEELGHPATAALRRLELVGPYSADASQRQKACWFLVREKRLDGTYMLGPEMSLSQARSYLLGEVLEVLRKGSTYLSSVGGVA